MTEEEKSSHSLTCTLSAKLFKNIVNSTCDISKEQNFEFNEDGLQIQCMDSSHVSLFQCCINKKEFLTYNCDTAMIVGIYIPSLIKLLKLCDDKDLVSMNYIQDADQINIKFDNNENDSHKRSMDFNLNLLNLDDTRLGIPEADFDAKFSMPSKEFKNLMNDIFQMSDVVGISIDSTSFKFAINSKSIGNGNISFVTNNTCPSKPVYLKFNKKIIQEFAVQYMVIFSKSYILSKQVVIQMSEDIPIQVTYNISDKSYITYYLAPKIPENEDDDDE